MSASDNLRRAKKEKNDEFYTQLKDIEYELQHYAEQFRGKTVYCNCDDPQKSNFFKYFSDNFEKLGLKRLIASCHKNNDEREGLSNKAVWAEYDGTTTEWHAFDGDGDFRSAESIELLKQADIVVTNPPFSLFREFVAQMIEHDKRFLIIGSLNAITYKDIFPLIKHDRLRLGYNTVKEFLLPNEIKANSNIHVSENTQKFGNMLWYTNLETSKRYENIILSKRYAPENYPIYENYDAINIDKVADIPSDYDGVMGVPITFLMKHNQEQFEIIGCMTTTKITKHNFGFPYVNGEKKYARILIRNKKPTKPQTNDE